MSVYLRADQVDRAVSEPAHDGAPFSYRRVVAGSFDGGDTIHVHLEPPTGRMGGLPEHGLLVVAHRAGEPPLEALPSDRREAAVRAALAELPPVGRPLLVVLCAAGSASFAWRVDAAAGGLEPRDTRLIPGFEHVFDRTRGILETGLLARRSVAIVGVGSGGSACALELARCGVGRFTLIDHDRLELHNVSRHACGVSDLGRHKTRAVRDLLLDRNPHAAIATHEVDVLASPDALDRAVAGADLVIAGTDNNASRRAINKAALRHGKVALYGRLMLRACGGDVLRARPRRGPCYECILAAVWRHREEEVSQARQAEALGYSDRPVVPEPGLSNDIQPVASMIVRLALQELVRGTPSCLAALDADLTSDFYFWANRREEQYARWQPMGHGLDGLSILRWYGIAMGRDPRCPACGAHAPVADADAAFFGG
ncbi:MAG: ThiF family adenylyltransferase [Deltaproteobacteria bacterium]|nr:ThiF family adenylyltransferase [Myxococcales bacterium]MDP3216471.1 ThiF family adenylyltransferase [Deltaproteobacteria bacterium]